MRKKLIGFLAVLTCFVFLTACGSSAQNDEVQEIPQETQSLLYSNTEMTAQQMDQVVTDGTMEDYKDYATVYSGIQSWESAKEEIGNIDFTTDTRPVPGEPLGARSRRPVKREDNPSSPQRQSKLSRIQGSNEGYGKE